MAATAPVNADVLPEGADITDMELGAATNPLVANEAKGTEAVVANEVVVVEAAAQHPQRRLSALLGIAGVICITVGLTMLVTTSTSEPTENTSTKQTQAYPAVNHYFKRDCHGVIGSMRLDDGTCVMQGLTDQGGLGTGIVCEGERDAKLTERIFDEPDRTFTCHDGTVLQNGVYVPVGTASLSSEQRHHLAHSPAAEPRPSHEDRAGLPPTELQPATCESGSGFLVTSAGTEEANGLYVQSYLASYSGPPVYQKPGTNLYLFRWARTEWFLAHVDSLSTAEVNGFPSGEATSAERNHRLYQAPATSVSPSATPVTIGWSAVTGQEPAPRVQQC